MINQDRISTRIERIREFFRYMRPLDIMFLPVSGLLMLMSTTLGRIVLIMSPMTIAFSVAYVVHHTFGACANAVAGSVLISVCFVIAGAYFGGKSLDDGTGNESGLAGLWVGASVGYIAALFASVLIGLAVS